MFVNPTGPVCDRSVVKRAIGVRAASLVRPGMCVGLGTGSTTAHALKELRRRVREEGLAFAGVATSSATERLARRYGFRLVAPDEINRIDVALDGADEIDLDGNLIKGRGAAHTREKVIASMADRFVILAEASKRVDRLGTKAPVPVEVLPMALRPVTGALVDLGGEPVLRMGVRKDGPVVTDQGFWILDVLFDGIDAPDALSRTVKQIPGVLDHGIFVGLATDLVIGEADGSVHLLP